MRYSGEKTQVSISDVCRATVRIPKALAKMLILVFLMMVFLGATNFAFAVDVREGNVSGNLTSWLMLGPLPNNDQTTRLSRDYLDGELGAAPVEGDIAAGATWTGVNFPEGDSINLEAYYNDIGASPYNCAFNAFVWINSPVVRVVRLEAGSDDGIVVLINGAQAIYNDTYRGINISNPDQADVYLREGWNRVLVKVSQGGGGTGFFLRFVNPDSTAISDLTWSMDKPALLTDAEGPTATLEVPPDLADPTPTLTGTISDVDHGGFPVVRAEYRVDGGDWQAAALDPVNESIGRPERTVTLTTPPLGSGNHTVELRGYDGWGNVTSEEGYAIVSFTLQLDPRRAAQRGLDYVIPAVTQWTTGYNCLGCHVQGVTLYGVAQAGSKGFNVDLTKIDVWTEKIRAFQEANGRVVRNIYAWDKDGENVVLNAHTIFGLASYDRYLGSAYTDVLLKEADWAVTQQQSDGRWALDQYEAPVDQGDIMVTASYVVGLAQARQRADSWRGGVYQDAIDKAMTWLRGVVTSTNQDKAYILLGLLAGGAGTDDSKVVETYNDLLDDQLSDGGWAERSGLLSNAYATGQAVYALRQAGLAYDSSQAQAGFEYLARYQNDNGSWEEGIRYVNTDAVRPSAFLSTIWPVIALSNSGERRYGVELSSDPTGADLEPGASVQYSIKVQNTAEVEGAAPDTFTMTLSVPEGWLAELDQSSLTLDPGASASVILSVQAPGNPVPGEVGNVSIRAESANAAANGESVYALLQVPSRTPDRAGPAVILDQNFTYAGDDTLIFSGIADEAITGRAFITAVEYQVDGTGDSGWSPATIMAGEGSATVTYQITAASLSPGSHTVYVRAKDVVGNYTSPDNYATLLVEVLYRGPLVILQPVNEINPDATPRVKGTASDVDLGNANISRVEYQVDDTQGEWLPATISQGAGTPSVNFWFDSPVLTEGQHTIYVRAVDSVEIPTGEENLASVTVDISSPDSQLLLDGYLRSWLFLGALEGTGLNQEMVPYEAALTPSAADVQNNFTWEPVSFAENLVDVNDYYNPWVHSGPPDTKTVYAHLYLYSPVEQAALLKLTSDDGIRIWLNGQQVFARDGSRGLDPNNLETSPPVNLQSGWNNLMVKVNELHSPWGFALRITNEAGVDLSDLTYQLNKPGDIPVNDPEVSFNEMASTEDVTPTLTGKAGGEGAPNVAYVEYQVDDTEGAWQRVTNVTPDIAGGVNFTFDSQPLDMGNRTIFARAMDQWGNWGSGSTQLEVRYNPFDAAQKGLDWVIPQVRSWTENNNCLGCHVQGVPLYGAAVAQARGYRVDTAQLDYLANFIHDAQQTEGYIDRYRKPGRYGIELINNAYALFGLAAYDSLVNNQYQGTLLAAVDWVLTRQQVNGRWVLDHNEPPVDQGDIMTTGSMMTALARAAEVTSDQTKADAYSSALNRAAAWLVSVTASTTQDKTYKLLGLMAAGMPKDDPVLVAARQDLIDSQRADGGWAEQSGLTGSNSYATGQAVYALRLSGLGSSDQAVSRGLGYLIKNQRDDGSWNEGVRYVNTDAGRPSSFTATIWGVIALGDVAQYGVNVDTLPGEGNSQVLDPGTSTVYNVKITNTSEDPFGEYDLTDTYDLAASVDLPGWDVQLDQPEVTLAEGEEAILTVTVTAPAESDGETAYVVVTATSRGAADKGGSAVGKIDLLATVPPQTGTLMMRVVPQRPGDLAAVIASAYPDALASVAGVSVKGQAAAWNPDNRAVWRVTLSGDVQVSVADIVVTLLELGQATPEIESFTTISDPLGNTIVTVTIKALGVEGVIDGTPDGQGGFRWEKLNPGFYVFQVSGPGYLAREVPEIAVFAGETGEHEINLVYGDFDADGKINILDLIRVAMAYGRHQGEDNWDPSLDVVPDEKVDLFDLVRLARSWSSP